VKGADESCETVDLAPEMRFVYPESENGGNRDAVDLDTCENSGGVEETKETKPPQPVSPARIQDFEIQRGYSRRARPSAAAGQVEEDVVATVEADEQGPDVEDDAISIEGSEPHSEAGERSDSEPDELMTDW
jgi:hypothetical protein